MQANDAGTRRQAWITWILATVFAILVFVIYAGYADLGPRVGRALQLEDTQVSLVSSIYAWIFAATLLFSGAALDRFRSRFTLPVAAAAFSLGLYAYASAASLATLVLGHVLMAIGGSFGFVGAAFVSRAWHGPARYGPLFGLVQFVAALCALVTQQGLAAFLGDHDWRDLLHAAALGSAALAAVMFLLVRDPARDMWQPPSTRTGLLQSLGQVLSLPASWLNTVIAAAMFGSMLSLAVLWGPAYLGAAGLDQPSALRASSFAWLGLALGSPLFPLLSRRLGSRRRPLIFAMALQLLILLWILLRGSMSELEASTCFGIWGLMAGAAMLCYPIAAELVASGPVATSAAVVNAGQFIAGGLLTAAPGWILDTTPLAQRALSDYQWALLPLPIALALAWLGLLFLPETQPGDIQHA